MRKTLTSELRPFGIGRVYLRNFGFLGTMIGSLCSFIPTVGRDPYLGENLGVKFQTESPLTGYGSLPPVGMKKNVPLGVSSYLCRFRESSSTSTWTPSSSRWKSSTIRG